MPIQNSVPFDLKSSWFRKWTTEWSVYEVLLDKESTEVFNHFCFFFLQLLFKINCSSSDCDVLGGSKMEKKYWLLCSISDIESLNY